MRNFGGRVARIVLLSSLLGSVSFTVAPRAEAAVNAPTVSKLRVEYMENPLGIDVAAPRFSWQGTDLDRGDGQSKFQIRVASTAAGLATGPFVWDSGVVQSNDSIHVVYGGPPLVSRASYAWNVRIWDRAGNASVVSAAATFEMGLLSESDWSARYIGAVLRYARTTFTPTPDATIAKARVYVAGFNPLNTLKYPADGPTTFGAYDLLINGARVGADLYEPNWTNADKRVLYRTYDVTSMIRSGNNVIGLMMSRPKVAVQLEITYTNGTRSVVVTNNSWKTMTSPVTSSNFMSQETYDARMELDWQSPTFDDSSWTPAEEAANPAPRRSAATSPPIRVTERVTPVSVTALPGNVYLVDLGNEYAAIPSVTIDGVAGTSVLITYSEGIDATNAQFATFGQRDTFILKQGPQTLTLRFAYRSFRYMTIKLWAGAAAPTTATVRALAVNTVLENQLEFKSTNQMYNRIDSASRRTLLNNIHGHPEDCPHREKAGWGADANAASEPMLYNFGATPIYAKWLNDLADAQNAKGGIPSVVGLYSGEAAWIDPAWATVYPMLTWNLYRYSGDVRVLEQHYDGIKRFVDYLGTRATNLIIKTPEKNWGQDWAAYPGFMTSYQVFDTAYYFIDAGIVAKMAGLLGKTNDAAAYQQLADNVKTAFNREFYNSTNHTYGGGGLSGQATTAIPLVAGLVPAGDEAAVANALVAQVVAANGKLPAGVVGNQFIHRALVEAGRSDLVAAWMNQTTKPSYGYMLDNGPGTLWEYWDVGTTLSRNHPAFAATTVWLYESLAGLSQTDASVGFEHLQIAAHPDPSVTSVNLNKATPYGTVVSNWWTTSVGYAFSHRVTIPFNSDAIVSLPIAGVANPTILEGTTVIYANGAFTGTVAGVAAASATADSVSFTVGSGTYTFRVRAG